MTWLSFAGIGCIAALCVWTWSKGYDKGVVDTEKRWSDAVAKGEWDKKYRGT